MPRFAALLAIGLFTRPLSGLQAPQGADLWRLAAATLARPAALASGVAGTLWNPAPLTEREGPALGVQVFQTPDVLGVSGVTGVLATRLSPHWDAGLMAGRMDVQDLVRTTTSPVSEPGSIPVYSQFIAAVLGARVGMLQIGTLVTLHDARFDGDHSNGVTTDVGLRLEPVAHLTLAASTHWWPADFSDQLNTDFYAGAAYEAGTTTIAGARARITARYGLTVHRSTDVDHGLGLGVLLDDQFSVDAEWARETAFGNAEWRPALAVGYRFGHYTIAVGRGGGLNGLGPTYRVSLDAGRRP